jgi:hypothetical protein
VSPLITATVPAIATPAMAMPPTTNPGMGPCGTALELGAARWGASRCSPE